MAGVGEGITVGEQVAVTVVRASNKHMLGLLIILIVVFVLYLIFKRIEGGRSANKSEQIF